MSTSEVDRDSLWFRLQEAVAATSEPLSTPVFVVDLDAFDANADDLTRRAAGKPIRVASKSIRIPGLLQRALAHDGFAGILAYTLAEALWLEEQEICDDILVAYPTVDRGALTRLVASPRAAGRITLMIDDAAHLDVVDSVRSSTAVPIRIALDVDAGLQVGNQHVGPKRSPLLSADAVARLAQTVIDRQGFRLVGVMTYEGQVAGLQDAVPSRRVRSLAMRGIKSLSLNQLATRRGEVARALAPLVELEFWNAGGSGSIAETGADTVVTELAAGSGLFVPTLFDHYLSFKPRPAAFYGLPVTRRPSATLATVHGGGFVASGPIGPDRLARPWAPSGLSLTSLEGTGEVQTPLTGPGAAHLAIGDLVWFRHAKSGELFEHGTTVHLLSGREFVGTETTYRGHGLAF